MKATRVCVAIIREYANLTRCLIHAAHLGGRQPISKVRGASASQSTPVRRVETLLSKRDVCVLELKKSLKIGISTSVSLSW